MASTLDALGLGTENTGTNSASDLLCDPDNSPCILTFSAGASAAFWAEVSFR